MNALRQEIHTYIDEIPEARLAALRPLLSVLADDTAYIETNLTAEEIAMIDAGMKRYEADPSSYVPLSAIL